MKLIFLLLLISPACYSQINIDTSRIAFSPMAFTSSGFRLTDKQGRISYCEETGKKDTVKAYLLFSDKWDSPLMVVRGYVIRYELFNPEKDNKFMHPSMYLDMKKKYIDNIRVWDWKLR